MKIQIYQKGLKQLDYNHYLINNITTSLDLTWLRSLVRKLLRQYILL